VQGSLSRLVNRPRRAPSKGSSSRTHPRRAPGGPSALCSDRAGSSRVAPSAAALSLDSRARSVYAGNHELFSSFQSVARVRLVGPEVVVGLCIERSLAMLVGCSASSYARARDVGCHAKAFGRPSRCSVTWSKTWTVASRAGLKSQGDGQQTFSAVNPKTRTSRIGS
jgi:capsid protein